MNTPADGKPSPIPTDRGLLLIAMENPGVGHALGEIHNIFQRAIDAASVVKTAPCKTCGFKAGYGWNGVVWCVTTRCADFHTVFTVEEWQERGREKLIEARNAEY